MCAVLRAALRDVDDTMPELAGHLYRQIEQHLGRRVLDAGAGVGLFSSLLTSHGKQAVALESDRELVPTLKSRLEREGGEVYDCDLADPGGLPEFGPADSAICINVAEHIQDDRQALLNLRRRLVPGGKLVILVPAHPWLYNRIDKTVGHVRRYTRRTLLTVLEESGWETASVTYFNFLSIPAWFIAGTVLRKDMPGRSMIATAGRVMPIMNWLDKNLARGGVGISLVAVARNPGPIR